MKDVKISEIPSEAPLTLVCHKGDINVVNDKPDVLEIAPWDTLAAADAMLEGEQAYWFKVPWFCELVEGVIGEPPDPRIDIKQQGSGMRHIVGMLLLIWKAKQENKQIFLRLPETYLHPHSQAQLVDLFIKLGLVPKKQ